VVLIKHWLSSLNKNKSDLLQLLLSQLESANDIAVMFTIIECLNILVKSDQECNLNYELILNASAVTITHLLTQLTSPNYVWEISRYLGNLLHNCRDQVSLNILNTLNNLDIASIIDRNPNLMKSVFADIFSNILKSSPDPSFIFASSLSYLKISVQVLESDDVERMLKFWVTFLRNTDANKNEINKEVIAELFKLFKDKFNKIFSFMNQDENIAALMILVEELILAEFQFDNFSEFLMKFYELCKRENNGSTIRLKNDFFSIVTSYFLYMQGKGLLSQVPLDFILARVYEEMVCEINENPKKSETGLRNQITALFGRMIFVNVDAVLAYLHSRNINHQNLLTLLRVLFLILDNLINR
jgi:hypothetical protein